MRINLLLSAGFIATAAFMSTGSQAFADDPKLLGEHGSWKAYSFAEKGSKTCYALSQPTNSLPKNVRRDPIYLLVTNKLKPRVNNEVSVITGYPYKKNSTTTANIGGAKFNMYTNADGAWVDGAPLQKRMVATMKNGNTIIVKGTSSRGTLTTDTYSLAGFTAALTQINEACK